MRIFAIAIVVGVIVVAVAVYQLVKSKKAVTVAAVKAQVSTDAAAVKTDVKKV